MTLLGTFSLSFICIATFLRILIAYRLFFRFPQAGGCALLSGPAASSSTQATSSATGPAVSSPPRSTASPPSIEPHPRASSRQLRLRGILFQVAKQGKTRRVRVSCSFTSLTWTLSSDLFPCRRRLGLRVAWGRMKGSFRRSLLATGTLSSARDLYPYFSQTLA